MLNLYFCDKMIKTSQGKTLFTIKDLAPIIKAKGIIDGTKGGLIKGNTNIEGGIPVIRKHKDSNHYEIIAVLEQWEYLICPETTSKYLNFFRKINKDAKLEASKFRQYTIPQTIQKIDASPIIKNLNQTSKIILLGYYSQFIVNKFATKKHLMLIDAMNKNQESFNSLKVYSC